MGENEGKRSEKYPFATQTIENVYQLIKSNRRIKYTQMEENLGIDDNTVQRSIAWLKQHGYLPTVHAKVKGEWQLI